MPQFALLYYADTDTFKQTREQQQAHFVKYRKWLDGLGEAVVNPGTPVMKPAMVTKDGVQDSNPDYYLTGWTIVEAENVEAAIDMTQRCPYLDIGAMEVAELQSMES